MPSCETCNHFRPVRPPSDLLASALESMEAKVVDTLAGLRDAEEKTATAEAAEKLRHAGTDDPEPQWPTRPAMSAYCGLRESPEQGGVYLISEVKNSGGRCGDHSEQEPKGWCTDCVHRVAGAGHSQDEIMDTGYARSAMNSKIFEASSSDAESSRFNYRDGIASRMAFETGSAHRSGGVTARVPKYLDHCSHYSREGEYVVCVLQNRHGRCPAHTPMSSAAATIPVEVPMATREPEQPASEPGAATQAPAGAAMGPVQAPVPKQPEVFEIRDMSESRHPTIENLILFARLTDDLFSSDRAGLLVTLPREVERSMDAPHGLLRLHFSFDTMPNDVWLPMHDEQGQVLPFRIYLDRGLRVLGMWLN